MIDYAIIDINEAIEGLSYQEQLEYLNDREDDINGAIEELNTLLADVKERKDEIEDEHLKETCDKALQALNNISLKKVCEILGMKFFIPSYQRGYRWGKLQIENLLKDIDEFDNQFDGNFYCLQPLVVRKLNDDVRLSQINDKFDWWCVIDGQQRLTTIYLILKALDNKEAPIKVPTLEYERESYIETCDKSENVDNSNIEVYHLTTAKQIIRQWIKEQCKDQKTFLNKLLEQTQFIFYDVGDVTDKQEHDIFNNLNSGKIALTNAELIKALFLNKVGKEDIMHREVEQRLLADEFDQIERTLRRDDFWYFLAGNGEKPSSCINLLFDLMLNSSENSNDYSKEENFRTFFYFNNLINGCRNKESYKKSKEIWKDVQKVFHIIEGWFNDSVMYNLIGYHRAANGGETLCEIYKKFNEFDSKAGFKNWLKEQCKELVDYPDDYMNLRYDTNIGKVFNLLLLFNIATLNEKPEESVKFSFANLHKNKWDVEHISPQSPKDNEELKKAIQNKKIFESLLKAIEDKNEETIDEERKKYFATEDELMGIQNLTLLIDHDNRGIGNNFFFKKREKLQEYYQNGSFIPACSMNVFMKFYSKNPEQMDFWDKNDRNSYKEKIMQTINNFFDYGK